MLKVGLRSDFTDYYDFAFAGSWQEADVTLDRFSTDGPSRADALRLLLSLGLRVPTWGRVRELVPHLLASWTDATLAQTLESVVVYTDEHAHCGEGKLQMRIGDALAQYPDALASRFIPSGSGAGSVSLRYLRLGVRQFWLRYSSANDWRSNCGDVTVEVLTEEKRVDAPRWQEGPLARHVLFAIDFVPADRLFAVDFNVAPGLRGSGIEDLVSPAEAVEALGEALLARRTYLAGDAVRFKHDKKGEPHAG